jgi:hypothetical protein
MKRITILVLFIGAMSLGMTFYESPALFDLSFTQTNPGEENVVFIGGSVEPTESSATTFYGLHTHNDVLPDVVVDLGQVNAIVGDSKYKGIGHIDEFRGLGGHIEIDSGTVALGNSIQASTDINGSAVVRDLVALNIRHGVNVGSQVENMMGIAMGMGGDGLGSVGTNYGILIRDLTYGDTRWAIYVTEDDVYFGGDVLLRVDGTIQAITVGPPDSAEAGFRLLRIPN